MSTVNIKYLAANRIQIPIEHGDPLSPKAARDEKKKLKLAKEKANEERAKAVNEQIIATIRDKGVDHMKTLTVGVLRDLIRYCFCSDEYKGQKKNELILIVKRCFEKNDGEQIVRESAENNDQASVESEADGAVSVVLSEGSNEDVPVLPVAV